MITLVLGGARSGKSRFAEQYAEQTLLPVTYIATAMVSDLEMKERIERHQSERCQSWALEEAPFDLALAIRHASQSTECILVDCLTLWLNNCLFQERSECSWADRKSDFLLALQKMKGPIVLVSNEVGQGIVPMGEVSRQFVDESGWLHQDIAKIADRVIFVTAGLPQVLKGTL